jgi:hypothetical protein
MRTGCSEHLLIQHATRGCSAWRRSETIASLLAAGCYRAAVGLEEVGPRLLNERVALPYDLFLDTMPKSHLGVLSLSRYLRSPDALCVHGGLDPSGLLIWSDSAGCISLGHGRLRKELCARYRRVRTLGDAQINSKGWPVPRMRSLHHRHRYHRSRCSHSHSGCLGVTCGRAAVTRA